MPEHKFMYLPVGSEIVSNENLYVCKRYPITITNATPSRHNEHWTDFEKEMLEEAFSVFVKDRAMKHGRTEIAISGKLRKMMVKFRQGGY